MALRLQPRLLFMDWNGLCALVPDHLARRPRCSPLLSPLKTHRPLLSSAAPGWSCSQLFELRLLTVCKAFPQVFA